MLSTPLPFGKIYAFGTNQAAANTKFDSILLKSSLISTEYSRAGSQEERPLQHFIVTDEDPVKDLTLIRYLYSQSPKFTFPLISMLAKLSKAERASRIEVAKEAENFSLQMVDDYLQDNKTDEAAK